MLIFFGQHRWTMVDLGTNDGRLGLQPPYGSLVVSSPTSSSFKSVPPWHYVILCQLPMINLKLHRSATTWPRQIIVIIDLLKLGSTILTHQSQDGSMSVFRKAESLTSVPFCRWRHILQKVYPMLVVKQWLAFPTILPEIKSEKKNMTVAQEKSSALILSIFWWYDNYIVQDTASPWVPWLCSRRAQLASQLPGSTKSSGPYPLWFEYILPPGMHEAVIIMA